MMEAHAICKILPELTDGEYKALVADIRAKGLLRPITTFEGKILDGRHRFNACADAGVPPRFEEYAGSDPVGFVQSTCMHRSLNTTQRAMIAAGFLAYEREQARKRQVELGRSHGSTLMGDFPEGVGTARDKAGERMGVDGKTVTDAAKVLTTAVPEVIAKMKTGEMALNEAKRIAALNPIAQRRIVQMDKKQRRAATDEAQIRSIACKQRDSRPEQKPEPDQFAKVILAGLERLAMYAAENGCKTPQQIADRFARAMDWESLPMRLQFERCAVILQSVELLHERDKA